MLKLKTLVFHPALAPYRVDFFNRLRHELDMHLVFFSDHIAYHRELNQDKLRDSLKCEHQYLLCRFRFLKRDFPIGIGRIIEECAPDVVVSHEFSYPTLSIMLYRKLFAKQDFGHALWTAENIHMLRSRGMARTALRRICSKAADSMLVYSKAIAEGFTQRLGIPAEKMFICANHQEEKMFAAKLDSARSLVPEHVRAYHLSGKKVVLFVGRLTGVKNLERATEAFACVSRKDSKAMLVMVGDGPLRNALEDQASHIGIADKVLFTGHQEGNHLYAWYLLSSVFMLASIWEPYGAVVNESLLAGVPVLCSSHAGASVLIREGDNGHVFDPNDTDLLSFLMKEALTDAPTAEIAGASRRESLMPVPFERDVASFVQAVKYANSHKNNP